MSAISDPRPRIRDPRLDFFRGLGMFIILISHIPWNSWAEWIPARFGFSDGADMFVFCSGMASGLAFARVFEEQGWLIGALRIAHRCWQVYWAHVCSFIVVLSAMVAADHFWAENHYVTGELNLADFFEPAPEHLLGLITLYYVPNYFDILPMYMVVLAMVPVVILLARFSRWLVFAFIVVLWALANYAKLEFIADPWTGRPWFFNPFGWQLLFFTGFSFVRGWLPKPRFSWALLGLSIVYVVLAAPVSCQQGFNCYAGFGAFPVLGRIHNELLPLIDKIDYGPLRYLHFLALAYLAFLAAGEHGRNLSGAAVDIVRRVGQQTLGVFLAHLLVAQLMGIVLDQFGRGIILTGFVNVLGCALLVATAFVVNWFKNPPWLTQRKPAPRVAPVVAQETPGAGFAVGGAPVTLSQ